jgi:hypothetical protein
MKAIQLAERLSTKELETVVHAMELLYNRWLTSLPSI